MLKSSLVATEKLDPEVCLIVELESTKHWTCSFTFDYP